MKARIEKKLSKRAAIIAPTLIGGVWIDDDISELSWKQKTRVSHIHSVGGGLDYWGEGTDYYTVWTYIQMNWDWLGNFPQYPEGHKHAWFPDTGGFKPTPRNLLKLLANSELKEAEKEKANMRRREMYMKKYSGGAQ